VGAIQVGLDRTVNVYSLYMTIYLVISLPKIPYIICTLNIYMVRPYTHGRDVYVPSNLVNGIMYSQVL